MFGSKLRAWMEAVRPKKKQHRKDKQAKNTTLLNSGLHTNDHTITWKNTCLLEGEKKGTKQDTTVKYLKSHNETNEKLSRYSATNLSSPESAYSTGYSTDGTSPGAGAPPEYLIDSSNKRLTEESLKHRLNPAIKKQIPDSSETVQCSLKSQPCDSSTLTQDNLKIKENTEENASTTTIASSTKILGNISENTSVLVSPRQRNRIRTNPWLPGGTTSAVPSPLPVRQEGTITSSAFNKFINSPIHHRYLSPVSHRRSLSSSSCSSLSAGPNHSFDHHFPRSLSDEEDCTLNEMMGKYDESYVYEKETDILSDSDPTDCESDLDTGQDGGDEAENADAELDFIDHGSFVDIDRKIDNTGHCLYFIPSDMQRKRSSRRRTTRKVKESSDRRRRTSASKKACRHSAEKTRHWSHHQDGSKSAGATPLSVRKSDIKPHRHIVQDEFFKKRSNSVCLQRDTTVLIDKRDREADLKYKELIGQAEQIIRTMNINGLSPRRLPGPTNKRVELLRSTECAKPGDVIFKSKPTDEPLISHSVISPSTASFKNIRFSPKKNHITNFIINNSPVLVRKELHQVQSPVAIKRNLTIEAQKSPRTIRKDSSQDLHRPVVIHPGQKMLTETIKEYREVYCGSPTTFTKNHHPKSILHKTEHQVPISILSPRHRRETDIPMSSSSSEEESFQRSKNKLSKSCPQSEPMRRKSYSGRNTFNVGKGHGKTVAFNLQYEIPNASLKNEVGSSENLRHQVLLNTIQSLKQNLEDQSASLHQRYKGTQRPYKY